MFNRFFSSVFTHSNDTAVSAFQLNHEIPLIADIEINPDTVYAKLVSFNPDKATGPYGWPILALKETALQIHIPLAMIFDKSLYTTGILPDARKQWYVIPIHNKLTNYHRKTRRCVHFV